jgi:hypothetical protein
MPALIVQGCCIHYGMFAAYDSFLPAARHPEASHANVYASRFSFSEAEGSAPLHPKLITNCLDHRVALKSSGADPSPSRLEHNNVRVWRARLRVAGREEGNE